METKTVKFVVAILMFMTIAFTVQSAVLYSEMTELRTEVNGHADDIYVLMRSDSARQYTIMDTIIRVFHYAKPHKSPAWACPECAEIHEKTKKNGGKPAKEKLVNIIQQRAFEHASTQP